MAIKHTQRGITLLGFLMVMMVVGAIAFIFIRLFPVYTEYYSVVGDMKGVQSEPGIANATPQMIKDKLFRRFYISYVDSVKQENVKITRDKGYNLRVTYEVRKPLVYNLDFVAKFDKTVDLTRAGGD